MAKPLIPAAVVKGQLMVSPISSEGFLVKGHCGTSDFGLLGDNPVLIPYALKKQGQQNAEKCNGLRQINDPQDNAAWATEWS